MAAKMEGIDLIRSRRTLNTTFLSTKKSIPGVELAERLRKSLLNLKSKFISANGKIVDYEKLKQSREFQDYKKDAVDLQIVDVIKMSDIEKKAFFI
ncbi:Glutaredoxin-1, partial [Biomphalaria glabrata]